MNKIELILFLVLGAFRLQAQTFDQLNANTSAAFVLMGISPTEIATPTNVGEFAASVQDATKNLSVLPENYAIEVPLYSNSQGINKRNVLTLSGGYSRENNEVDIDSKVGIGFRLSIMKQKTTDDSNMRNQFVNDQKNLLEQRAKLLNSLDAKNTTASIHAKEEDVIELIRLLGDKTIEEEIKSKILSEEANLDEIQSLDKAVEKLNTAKSANLEVLRLEEKLREGKGLLAIREHLPELSQNEVKVYYHGAFWDVHGGSSLSLGETSFNNIASRRVGLWTNAGYGFKNQFTLLASSKVLFEDINQVQGLIVDKNNTSIDFGAKAIFSPASRSLQITAEYMYKRRSLDMLGNTWKGVLNITYDIGNNQKLTLALGKDFDNDISKEGNVISLLNFVSSFKNKNLK